MSIFLFMFVHLFFYLFVYISYLFFFFFFQAEDGIRDFHVTGVQTCAPSDLPSRAAPPARARTTTVIVASRPGRRLRRLEPTTRSTMPPPARMASGATARSSAPGTTRW